MNKHHLEHDCIGLRGCSSHPRWFVTRYGYGWGAYKPLADIFPAHGEPITHAEAVTYATERARADQLAAITSSEGAGR